MEKQENMLAVLHGKFLNVLIEFRDLVCIRLQWSRATYYRKMRDCGKELTAEERVVLCQFTVMFVQELPEKFLNEKILMNEHTAS